jgi:hypothetical protein
VPCLDAPVHRQQQSAERQQHPYGEIGHAADALDLPLRLLEVRFRLDHTVAGIEASISGLSISATFARRKGKEARRNRRPSPRSTV